MYRALVLAALVLALPAAARADDAAVLYDPEHVSRIDIGLTGEAWQHLVEQPREYVPASITVAVGDRTIGPRSAEVKLKGRTSFRPIHDKAAFTVKFPKADRLLGLRKMTLNNMVQDASMIHETLAYEILRDAGVPAPRTGYAYVRVNGQGYGLYLNLEAYDSVSLARLFPSTQHLYEADVPVDVASGMAKRFEIDEGDEDDRADLYALIAAAGEPGAAWWPAVSAVADMAEMTRMWAAEQYVGHWDGYSLRRGAALPNNYYLHSDAEGRFSMLASGVDQTFAVAEAFPGGGDGVLIARCRGNSPCLAAFRAGLSTVSDAVEALGVGDRVDTLAAIVAPWRRCASNWQSTDDAWQAAVTGTRAFLRDRRVSAAAYLGRPAPAPDPALERTAPPPLSAAPCPLDPPPADPAPPDLPATQAAAEPAGATLGAAASQPRLTVRVGPAADRRAPYRFTVRGTLAVPAGTACGGRVAVRVKAGRRTIWVRRAAVRPDCSFSTTIALRSARRFAGRRRVAFEVAFEGAAGLLPATAPRRVVKVGRR